MANKDLISRQALMEAYDRAHEGSPGMARRLIEEATAVDAVEVVRCKNCKYKMKHANICTNVVLQGDLMHIWVDPDAYCKYGESKVEPAPELECNDCPAEDIGDEICEACEITYSWEHGKENVLGETNDARDE